MFFNMGVTLFTSRIILKTLGVQDFGIYNLVGGVVVLFSFLNGAMSSATQRFLNIEIAKGVKDRINHVFCTSMNIHIGISLVVLILAETLGLWFLNYKLNIPTDRMFAANLVFQMSILTTIIDITRIPYSAIILAYEKMSFYAYFGIFETVMKLLIVYMLSLFTNYDYLIVYGVLLMFVNLLGNIIYRVFCVKNFKTETHFRKYYDKVLTREMTSFSGWNLFGQVATVGANQGLSMVLNIFIGVTVNAAMGIANQVNAAIYNFISNFQIAFNPQIIQTYALNDFEKHRKLVINTSKYSFYLMSILAAPFLLHTEFILHLWLGDIIPQFVIPFTRVIILSSLFDALCGPLWMSAHATGKIRNYQLSISFILLLNLPLSYLLLKLGYSPVYVLVGKLGLSFIAFIYRFYFIKKIIHLSLKDILAYVSNIIPIFILFGGVFYLLKEGRMRETTWSSFFLYTLILETIIFFSIFIIGIGKSERNLIYSFIKSKFGKNA
ncbi:hypothetical protein D3C87_147500 [compost metagenome]